MQPNPEIALPSPAAEIPLGDFFVRKEAGDVPSMRVTTVTQHAPCEFAGGIMTDLIFKLTVNQLCGVIRQQGIDPEAETMLGMLESIVIAGEIALPDFMERVQNLFPHIFARIDRELIKKLTEIAAD